MNEKPYENISIYGAKPLRFWFDKIDRFAEIYDGIRYLILFAPERYNAICDRIKYLISEKCGIRYSINSSFARIKIDSYNSLPIEKTFTSLIILVKSVVNKNENNY